MRINFELEDDDEEEFRVEFFTSKRTIRQDEFISLGASALNSIAKLEDNEVREKRTREIMDAMRSEIGNRGGVTIVPDPPGTGPHTDPSDHPPIPPYEV